MAEVCLYTENVCKTYFTGKENKPVLADCSISVKDGDFLCIVGNSGCGKTTFLRILASFDASNSGDVYLKNQKVTKPDVDRLMVFQSFDQLFPWKTVLNNVIFALRASKVEQNKEKATVMASYYLDKVGLLEHKDKYPRQLSGGMIQRAVLAKALALHPQVLLMDEPFGSLDAITRQEMQKLLKQMWLKFGTTVIFVTHDIYEALFLGTHIAVMGSLNEKRSKSILEIIDIHDVIDKNGMANYILSYIGD